MNHTTRRPGDPLPVPAAELVARANARVRTLSLDEAGELVDDPGHLFVDVRDPREREANGVIDPESPYYKPALDDGRTLVLYCGSAWRSALSTAALHDMGRTDVAHLEGGFSAWSKAGLPTEEYRAS